MCLLFQRQDENVETIWDGRVGQYLNPELRATAERFPTRRPSDYERTGRHEPRTRVETQRVK